MTPVRALAAVVVGVAMGLCHVGTALPRSGDFDADGADNLLLRRVNSDVWRFVSLVDGAPVEGELALDVEVAWGFAATGDFDGNGYDDLLLRRRGTRDVAVHAISAGGVLKFDFDVPLDPNYDLVGTGDFDGDGTDEILMRRDHSPGTWIYRDVGGVGAQGVRRFGATPNLDWEVAGIGDMDGDGRDDVLLRHGKRSAWVVYMGGVAHKALLLRPRMTRDPTIVMEALADLDGDGRADPLLRNSATGEWLWYSTGSREGATESMAMHQRGGLGMPLGHQWLLAAIGDWHGDGRASPLLRNQDTGRWRLLSTVGNRWTGSDLSELSPVLAWRSPNAHLRRDSRNIVVIPANQIETDPRTGRTPLHDASLADAPMLIRGLVDAGVSLDATDIDGQTALHLAAESGNTAAIAALLEAGANIEARNHEGATPLMEVVKHGFPWRDARVAVDALLAAGADPNATDLHGATVLFWATFGGTGSGCSAPALESHTALIVSALLQAGADPNWSTREGNVTALHFADPEAAVALLEAGADANARNHAGRTPLHYWAAGGHVSARLAALLEGGADVLARNLKGATPLHEAAERDQPRAVAALLDAGASTFVVDAAGRTPLHVAAASMARRIPVSANAAIVVLLEAGADPEALDHSGATALHLTSGESTAVMSALLDAHAGRHPDGANASDAFGSTPLHAAARADSPRLIGVLARGGANLDATDDDRHTPLMEATGASLGSGWSPPARTHSPAAVAALAAQGADLELRGGLLDRTALHHAVERAPPGGLRHGVCGADASIQALLDAGADPFATDAYGTSVLTTALLKGTSGVIAALAKAVSSLDQHRSSDFSEVISMVVTNPAALSTSGFELSAVDVQWTSLGRTALHWAALWDESTSTAAALGLAHPDLINAQDHRGCTPLHLAVERGNDAMASVLLKSGADPSLQCRSYRRGGGGTPLHLALWHPQFPGKEAADRIVLDLLAAGADTEARNDRGYTALHVAALEGNLGMIAALVGAGADLDAVDREGRTAIHLAAGSDDPHPIHLPFAPVIARLIESGADLSLPDDAGKTPLHLAAVARNRAAVTALLAAGAGWTSDASAVLGQADVGLAAIEVYQGPMIRMWEVGNRSTAGEMDIAPVTRHAQPVLNRPTTVAVRVHTNHPQPSPKVTVRTRDAQGRVGSGAQLVQGPQVIAPKSDHEPWMVEFVYELPAMWAQRGHTATFSVAADGSDSGEQDPTEATLTMDGHAIPSFDVTFIPIVFSGDPETIDAEAYMAIVGDLLPIGEYHARVGRPLDLTGQGLGATFPVASREAAVGELLHRWNAEGDVDEYYFGLMSSDEFRIGLGRGSGFGGQAVLSGNVAVAEAIDTDCRGDAGQYVCHRGEHAHELGHNLGLAHAPGNCGEPEPIDRHFPYDAGGIGRYRGWAISRTKFVYPEASHALEGNAVKDVMTYCEPVFVSDYNYNKMVQHRRRIAGMPERAEPRWPTLTVGPPREARSTRPEESSHRQLSTGPERRSLDAAPALAPEPAGPSLAITGFVDDSGWTTPVVDASTKGPRPPAGARGDYTLVLREAGGREFHREDFVLHATHGERRAWTARVPMPRGPANLSLEIAVQGLTGEAILTAPIDVPPLPLR